MKLLYVTIADHYCQSNGRADRWENQTKKGVPKSTIQRPLTLKL